MQRISGVKYNYPTHSYVTSYYHKLWIPGTQISACSNFKYFENGDGVAGLAVPSEACSSRELWHTQQCNLHKAVRPRNCLERGCQRAGKHMLWGAACCSSAALPGHLPVWAAATGTLLLAVHSNNATKWFDPEVSLLNVWMTEGIPYVGCQTD